MYSWTLISYKIYYNKVKCHLKNSLEFYVRVVHTDTERERVRERIL